MIIGVDLDNTIICYDILFQRVAAEKGWLQPSPQMTKTSVKAALLRNSDHAHWIELQGLVYGNYLSEARPYPDALAFFHACYHKGHSVCIISHKTQYPISGRSLDQKKSRIQPRNCNQGDADSPSSQFLGSRRDLREAALDWLIKHKWLEEGGLRFSDIEFTDTRQAKIAAIKRRKCEVFIDDLPEIFEEEDFPTQTQRYLFDPENEHSLWSKGTRVRSWLAFRKVLLKDCSDEEHRTIAAI